MDSSSEQGAGVVEFHVDVTVLDLISHEVDVPEEHAPAAHSGYLHLVEHRAGGLARNDTSFVLGVQRADDGIAGEAAYREHCLP